jgi:hypothetical protein
MNDFYVTLHSSIRSSESNVQADFVTVLGEPIRGTYEVALCDIGFRKYWHNITDSNRYLYVGYCPDFHSELEPEFSENHLVFGEHKVPAVSVSIASGQYDSIRDIVHKINFKLNGKIDIFQKGVGSLKNFVRFRYDSGNGRVHASIGKDYIVAFCDSGLNEILGFKDKVLYHSLSAQAAPFSPLLLNQPTFVHVILDDLTEPVNVGGKLLSIVDTVPLVGRAGGFIGNEYINRCYIKLRTRYVTRIRLRLIDHQFRRLPIRSGELYAILHFRRTW